MTNEERLAAALLEVRRRLARDGFLDELRAEMRLPENHPRSTEGNALLEAALTEVAAEPNRLEGGQEHEPAR